MKPNSTSTDRKYAIGFLIVGSIILGFSLAIIVYRSVKLTAENTTRIEGTLLNNPVELKGTRGTNEKIELSLYEYPNTKFRISGIIHNVTKTSNLLSELKTGDKVILKIEADDDKENLTKNIDNDFWNRIRHKGLVSVYEVKTSEKIYLSLQDSNSAREIGLSSYGIIFFLIMGIGIIARGISLLIKKPVANNGYK